MPRATLQSPVFDALPIRQHNLAGRLFRAVAGAMTRQQNRKALARLDAHLLRDIGLSADDASSECAKRFWQD